MSEVHVGNADARTLSRLRDAIESALGRFARLVHRNAWKTILVFVVAIASLVTQLPRLQLDASIEGLLPSDHPVRASYDAFRDQFGYDQALLVAIETEDVFDISFLESLRALHEDLENDLPYVQDVTSLINVRHTRGEADGLIVSELLEEMPATAEDLAILRERVLGSALYVDQIISRDGRITTLIVRPDVYSSANDAGDELAGFGRDQDASVGEIAAPIPLTPDENEQLVSALLDVVDRHRGDDREIHVAGIPMMMDRLLRAMANDMARFTALALATISLALAVLFRRLAAVVLPLTVSLLAMLTTLSIMAIFGISLTSITQIMPSFLLAVGVGSSVHILVIFYQAIARGDSSEDAIAHALEHSGLAVIMTSLTTAGGMASFVSASIRPVHDLGVITPIGIMAALVFSLVLMPALLAVFPMRRLATTGMDRGSATRRSLAHWGDVATAHPWTMLAIWSLILLQAAIGIFRIELSHDPIAWFHPEDPFRISMEMMNRELSGAAFLDAVVDGGQENSIRSPDLMLRLAEMHAAAGRAEKGRIHIGKTISVVDVVKETHQALNENRADFYAIPLDPALLSQELLLFENSGADDLEDMVDSQFRLARFTMRIPLVDAIHYRVFIEETEATFARILGDAATIQITGLARIMMEVVHALLESLTRTYILAFIIITPLMMLLLGSVRIGLLSMIPNVAPVVITLGIMGWMGLPLEMFTLLIGSIGLGLAVDDTIHFMHNFRRYYEQSGDEREAVRKTLTTTGHAMLFTTVVLACGFFSYMQASMRNLLHFGMLTGIMIIFAFLADILLAPALMTLATRRAASRRARPRTGSPPAP